MILPTKHISQEKSLLGLGSVLISELERPQTVTSLWDRLQTNADIGTFERFILTLDFLHIVGILNVSSGMIQRREYDS